MAVKIRLRRMGSKKRPFYRLVVADSRYPRGGRFIEEIGYYNPVSNPIELKISEEKAVKWLRTGATPTDTVKGLLDQKGLIEKAKDKNYVLAEEHCGCGCSCKGEAKEEACEGECCSGEHKEEACEGGCCSK